MLNLFYKFVTPWAIATKLQIFKNRILGAIVNVLYPIYCKTTKIKTGIIEKNVVVSLTTFPARGNNVYLCLNSILRQGVRAEKVILWLAKSQFPNKYDLPKSILNLEKYGLDIRFCDDLKSYKKVFYAAQEYSDKIIVTADDDVLYPENWLDNLIKTSRLYPNCVVCYRAHRVVFDGDNVAPYSQWIGMSPNEKGPSKALVPIGVGGVLYPRAFFNGVELNAKTICEICPTTDDLWLKILGVLRGYKAVKVHANSIEWFTIKSSQKVTLVSQNVNCNLNDISLKKLMLHYKVTSNYFKETKLE